MVLATGGAHEPANEEHRPIQVRLELFPAGFTELFALTLVDPKPMDRCVFRGSTRLRERNERVGHAGYETRAALGSQLGDRAWDFTTQSENTSRYY